MSTPFYRLAYGGPNPEVRDFVITKANDAITRFSDKVVELDQNDEVHAAWVNLTLISGELKTSVVAWTKTSNECPTIDGIIVTDLFG